MVYHLSVLGGVLGMRVLAVTIQVVFNENEFIVKTNRVMVVKFAVRH